MLDPTGLNPIHFAREEAEGVAGEGTFQYTTIAFGVGAGHNICHRVGNIALVADVFFTRTRKVRLGLVTLGAIPAELPEANRALPGMC